MKLCLRHQITALFITLFLFGWGGVIEVNACVGNFKQKRCRSSTDGSDTCNDKCCSRQSTGGGTNPCACELDAVGCGACMGANACMKATDSSIGNNSCRGCFGKTGHGPCYKLKNSIVGENSCNGCYDNPNDGVCAQKGVGDGGSLIVGNNSCNSDGACARVSKSGSPHKIGNNSCNAKNICNGCEFDVPDNVCNSLEGADVSLLKDGDTGHIHSTISDFGQDRCNYCFQENYQVSVEGTVGNPTRSRALTEQNLDCNDYGKIILDWMRNTLEVNAPQIRSITEGLVTSEAVDDQDIFCKMKVDVSVSTRGQHRDEKPIQQILDEELDELYSNLPLTTKIAVSVVKEQPKQPNASCTNDPKIDCEKKFKKKKFKNNLGRICNKKSGGKKWKELCPVQCEKNLCVNGCPNESKKVKFTIVRNVDGDEKVKEKLSCETLKREDCNEKDKTGLRLYKYCPKKCFGEKKMKAKCLNLA